MTILATDKYEVYLRDNWSHVEDFKNSTIYTDNDYNKQIRKILKGKIKGYKYAFFTNILAKTLNPKIHYRVLQAQSELIESYDARSLCHKVVVPFEMSTGKRLGGSNEPFLSKSIRHPEIRVDLPARYKNDLKYLHDVLESYQQIVTANETQISIIFRTLLVEYSKLDKNYVDFPHIQSENMNIDIRSIIEEYLSSSGGGERMVVFLAAFSQTVNSGIYTIKAYQVNVSDTYAKNAGDIEFYQEKMLIKAIEVKDKPVTISDIDLLGMKAKQHKIFDYMIITRTYPSDFESISKKIKSMNINGLSISIMELGTILNFLNFLSVEQKIILISKIGDYLNEINARKKNKKEWEMQLRKIHGK